MKLFLVLSLSVLGFAQTPSSLPPDREISWKALVPNLIQDQKQIWTFPARLVQGQDLAPTAALLGASAALIALDPHDAPYFRRTTSFQGFNHAFSGARTSAGIVVAPVSLYLAGLIRNDSKMKGTALLAGEAVADAEILTTVMKDVDRRARPSDIPLNGNFSDTWFDNPGKNFHSNGSFPSGHTIAAFSVATVISRRYGKTHRWIPYASYGLAGLVGFSRLTLSAHFLSDVFMGGALGYSIARFSVLRN